MSPTPGELAFASYAKHRQSTPIHLETLDGNSAALPAFKLSLLSARAFMQQSLMTARRSGEKFQIEAGFLDRPDPNAFASYRDGFHLCGLHAGIVTEILNLSLYALAQPTTFKSVGNAAGETGQPNNRANALIRWFGPSPLAIGADIVAPKDPTRQALAEDIAQLMLRFVWFHELYHCLNGHVGFLQQYDQSAALHELPDQAAGLVVRQAQHLLSAATYQLMELDADRTAIWTMFQIQAAGLEHIPTIGERPLAERQKLTLFATALMVALFEDANIKAQAGADTHPHPYMRLHNLIRTVASNVTEGLDDMRPLFLEVLTEMNALEGLLPGLPDIEKFYADLMSPTFQKPMDDAEIALDDLRTRLQPFAYFNP